MNRSDRIKAFIERRDLFKAQRAQRQLAVQFPVSLRELSEIASRADVPVTKCPPGTVEGLGPPSWGVYAW